MRRPSFDTAVKAVLALFLVAASAACSKPQTATAPAASAPATTAAAPKAVVEPAAVEALQKMSAYLQTLNSYELTSNASRDLVNSQGQRLTVNGTTHYAFRRPNDFRIDVDTDYKDRRFYYDGKQLTVYAPNYGYYASVPAPGTIRETLNLMTTKYGIELPLQDLFRWSEPGENRAEKLTSGFLVGTVPLDGVDTDHYAYREGDVDWQVWIEHGARPIPRRLVIVDRSDPAAPTYDARLTWTMNPTLASDLFVFKPGHDDKPIRLFARAD